MGSEADMRLPFSRAGPRVRKGEFRTHFKPDPRHNSGEGDTRVP
jgi:hypothetical protein